MYEINCPFCEGKAISDVVDSKERVIGAWECDNGHKFILTYLRKVENKNE